MQEQRYWFLTLLCSVPQVVQSATSPVTCSTTAVKANFKHGYHVFGQQEATFHDVQLQGDMLLIARFYLKKRPQDALQDMFMEPSAQEASLYDEESLVAWTALPLVLCANNGERLNFCCFFVVEDMN